MTESPKTQRKAFWGAKGWVKACPLENFSSLHELSLMGLLGCNISWPQKHFFAEFSFNLHTPLTFDPKAYLIMHTLDAAKPPSAPHCCFSITQINRWRLDITPYASHQDYLDSLIRWHRCNYAKSQKTFENFGCEITFIEEDWSQHVDAVYQLYSNVAHRYSDQIYDINFFQAAAKRRDYKLLCAWFEGKMIGMILLQEELPTLHSACVGFDYTYSTQSYAYSWLHYVLIRLAIEAKKYQNIDVGLTAEESKKRIGFKPVLSRIDIYTKGFLTRGLMRAASQFIEANLTNECEIKLKLR